MSRADKNKANQILSGAKKVTSASPSQLREHGQILPPAVAGAQFLRIKRKSDKPQSLGVFLAERIRRGPKVNRSTTRRG